MCNINKNILDKISEVYIDCPYCDSFYDDEQYTCTVCWNEGGQGKINILNFLKENKDIL